MSDTSRTGRTDEALAAMPATMVQKQQALCTARLDGVREAAKASASAQSNSKLLQALRYTIQLVETGQLQASGAGVYITIDLASGVATLRGLGQEELVLRGRGSAGERMSVELPVQVLQAEQRVDRPYWRKQGAKRGKGKAKQY